jgi:integrator complex subunit 7
MSLDELIELDQKVRGTDWEQKVSSLLSFTSLFNRNHLLVPTGFLKLSEYYIQSKNQFRIFILKVFEESSQFQHHLKTKEIFLSRINSVLESNDPIARSLTIRLLGVLGQVSDSPELHYRLKMLLKDDLDERQTESVIFCVKKIAQVNTGFCLEISRFVYEQIMSGHDRMEFKPLFSVFGFLCTNLDVAQEVCFNMISFIDLI